MSASTIRVIRLRQLWLALLIAVAAGWSVSCGPLHVLDDTPYLGRSYDSREQTVVRLQFAEAGHRVAFTAELPNGEQCTGTFRMLRDTRPLDFLPPTTREFTGLLDSGLSAPCAEWAARWKDQGLALRLTYHPLVNRFRLSLVRQQDSRPVAGDWIVIRSDVPSS